jgi:hypothetical protein
MFYKYNPAHLLPTIVAMLFAYPPAQSDELPASLDFAAAKNY